MHQKWIPFPRFLSTFALFISPLKFAQPSNKMVVELINEHHLSPNFASLAPSLSTRTHTHTYTHTVQSIEER